jgi:hypothetical protein
MNLRNKEIVQFEPTKTTVVASPIATPFMAAVVTAKVGHIPRSSLNIGFSAIIPLVNSFLRPTSALQVNYIINNQTPRNKIQMPVSPSIRGKAGTITNHQYSNTKKETSRSGTQGISRKDIRRPGYQALRKDFLMF